jgi:hypothetical protein
VGERLVKYAIKGRGSWEGMKELINSVCGDYMLGRGRSAVRNGQSKCVSMNIHPCFLQLHGKRYVFRKPLLVSIYKST